VQTQPESKGLPLPPYPAGVFVRVSSPLAQDMQMLYEGSGRCGVNIALVAAAVVNFKIVDRARSSARTFAASTHGSFMVTLGTPMTLVANTNPDHRLLLVVNKPGLFRFTLDTTDPTVPVLTVSEAPDAEAPLHELSPGGQDVSASG
jgi:hypothetical protein